MTHHVSEQRVVMAGQLYPTDGVPGTRFEVRLVSYASDDAHITILSVSTGELLDEISLHETEAFAWLLNHMDW